MTVRKNSWYLDNMRFILPMTITIAMAIKITIYNLSSVIAITLKTATL